MTIRRIRRTLVVEYVTDRRDGDMPILSARDIGNGRVVSDVVAVVDAAVLPRVAAVEALVSQGVNARGAAEMFDRQRTEAYRIKSEAAVYAALILARANGEDPLPAQRAAYEAVQAEFAAEKLKEITI